MVRTLDPVKWAEIQRLQKGTHVMSRIHKPVEDLIVYLLYDLEWLGADHVSVLTYALAAVAAYLMATGSLAPALILAIVVGVLDGVDGKLARLRRRPTLIGKLEHSFDMLYEQSWYAAFTWWAWSSTGDPTYVALGLAWLILDSLVRHVYNVTWIATGRSLKYHPGPARIVTKVDGRRSVYVLHMVAWYLVGAPLMAFYTILAHCGATALAYLALSFRAMREAGVRPS
ncbi:MAG: hypothetical protein DRO06_04780 [Thermoproteota archaeon]|nr:MAG: hypothetical protein DRO06_04780 [Candidatus Korarchaeota archaeon]